MRSRVWRIVAGVTVAAIAALALVRWSRTPAADRQWHPAQNVTPEVVLRGDLLTIRNVRDFTYRSETDFDARFVERTFDLRELDSVWYGLSRFGSMPGLAHAFLSFGFGDEYVSISVEARKEVGEAYSPVRGLLREYELIYVIGSERDVIGLRTHIFREDVTLYPIRTTPERLRRVFLQMAARAEKLGREPEFYDTFFNSCSSNVVRHVDSIAPRRVGFDLRTVLPGFSDRTAYEKGLIDADLPLERVRELYRIDARARQLPLDENFSRAIRERLPPRASASARVAR